MEWRLERQAEVVDHHVRFLAQWNDRLRHVFIATALVEELAGYGLTREDAAAYVESNAGRFIEAAIRQAGRDGSDRTVIALERLSDLDP